MERRATTSIFGWAGNPLDPSDGAPPELPWGSSVTPPGRQPPHARNPTADLAGAFPGETGPIGGTPSFPSTSSIGGQIAVTGAVIGTGSLGMATRPVPRPTPEWGHRRQLRDPAATGAINTGNNGWGRPAVLVQHLAGYGGGQYASAANTLAPRAADRDCRKVLCGSAAALGRCGRGSFRVPRRVTSASPRSVSRPGSRAPLKPRWSTPRAGRRLVRTPPPPGAARGGPRLAPDAWHPRTCRHWRSQDAPNPQDLPAPAAPQDVLRLPRLPAGRSGTSGSVRTPRCRSFSPKQTAPRPARRRCLIVPCS